MKRIIYFFIAFIIASVGSVLFPSLSWAGRDAAFMAPGSRSMSSGGDESVTVEPKPDIDVGDTPMNVGRRATFFFVNQTRLPISIVSITANGDSNVKAEVVSDDCSKQKQIPAASRCAVTVEVMPGASGSWTAELLLTHTADGRIARARIIGKTGASSTEKHEMGLAPSTANIKPVDFGMVEVGTGKAVRTALMVNDSGEVISLLSIEVIEPENGLERLDQGCDVDMDLKIGESCPITMVWNPVHKGNISTDLIIRHSGQLGFTVIPVRGMATQQVVKEGENKTSSEGKPYLSSDTGHDQIPLSPTAQELDGMISNGTIPTISDNDLPREVSSVSKKSNRSVNIDDYQLIGTIGIRALIYKPDGTTELVAVGDDMPVGDGEVMKLTNVGPKEAEVFFKGEKVRLKLKASPELKRRAAESANEEMGNSSSDSSSKGKVSRGSRERRKIDNSSDSNSSSSVPLPVGTK